jgi:2',3'-cyclic-nucleotide 2'-phosphodiesterase
MKILFIGDVFGNLGKRVLAMRCEKLIGERGIDVCVANAENIAGGRGITHNLLKKLHKFGVQVITGGNHSLASPDSFNDYEKEPYLLRPLNLPPGNIGKGSAIFTLADGRKLGIINLMGRTYAQKQYDCPFRIGGAAVDEMLPLTRCIMVDFHADATSEKKAFARFVDGKVSAVLGTHTHVQTADESVSVGGTAFITDAGMTGPEDSIIGMKPEQVLKRFIFQVDNRFEPSESGPMLNAVIVDIDDDSGRARSIERIFERIKPDSSTPAPEATEA